MMIRSPNPFSKGWEDLLQELDGVVGDAVKSPPDQIQCRIVISGMGGRGKSEVCLQLANRLRSM